MFLLKSWLSNTVTCEVFTSYCFGLGYFQGYFNIQVRYTENTRLISSHLLKFISWLGHSFWPLAFFLTRTCRNVIWYLCSIFCLWIFEAKQWNLWFALIAFFLTSQMGPLQSTVTWYKNHLAWWKTMHSFFLRSHCVVYHSAIQAVFKSCDRIL